MQVMRFGCGAVVACYCFGALMHFGCDIDLANGCEIGSGSACVACCGSVLANGSHAIGFLNR